MGFYIYRLALTKRLLRDVHASRSETCLNVQQRIDTPAVIAPTVITPAVITPAIITPTVNVLAVNTPTVNTLCTMVHRTRKLGRACESVGDAFERATHRQHTGRQHAVDGHIPNAQTRTQTSSSHPLHVQRSK